MPFGCTSEAVSKAGTSHRSCDLSSFKILGIIYQLWNRGKSVNCMKIKHLGQWFHIHHILIKLNYQKFLFWNDRWLSKKKLSFQIYCNFFVSTIDIIFPLVDGNQLFDCDADWGQRVLQAAKHTANQEPYCALHRSHDQ